MVDMTGKRFGKLVVVSRAKSPNKQAAWLCKCDCGNETVVLGWNLRSGHTVSCGCVHKEGLKKGLRLSHGMANCRLYGIWEDMKSRCYNPNTPPNEWVSVGSLYTRNGYIISKPSMPGPCHMGIPMN